MIFACFTVTAGVVLQIVSGPVPFLTHAGAGEPYNLRVAGPATVPRDQRTSVGLLYSPETLRLLVARARATGIAYDPLIDRAVARHEPIVVLWRIKPSVEVRDVQWAPKYNTSIAPQNGNELAPSSPRPLWERRDARFLQVLDSSTPFDSVAVVAAFAPGDFQPGQWIFLWRWGTDPQRPDAGLLQRIFAEIPNWQ